ncbi:hypothetical protein ENH_00082520 [Eimeria necatrix]|uniref:ATPase AAA-type core domain-containing protein n=1 Tax=Eimeria necatrix TaxID=51315 RepID=U6N4W3_9EIME|nr:hypothetical protein ENH_00082520 [Eimeria necatrix]CDJ70334.1 hypothetical protein ENH_00082520 [Eimeria necatrix]
MPMVPSASHQGVLSDIESAMRDAKDSRMPPLFTSGALPDMVIQQAVEAVEQEGIVFIDEIDKICSKSGSGGYHGPDASDEGVQRDLLPLLEGSTVTTRYGDIRTDYILFIASALLATEGIVLDFRDDAISEVARVAWEINSQVENIGARRLHTVIEKVLDDINLNASLHAPGAT